MNKDPAEKSQSKTDDSNLLKSQTSQDWLKISDFKPFYGDFQNGEAQRRFQEIDFRLVGHEVGPDGNKKSVFVSQLIADIQFIKQKKRPSRRTFHNFLFPKVTQPKTHKTFQNFLNAHRNNQVVAQLLKPTFSNKIQLTETLVVRDRFQNDHVVFYLTEDSQKSVSGVPLKFLIEILKSRKNTTNAIVNTSSRSERTQDFDSSNTELILDEEVIPSFATNSAVTVDFKQDLKIKQSIHAGGVNSRFWGE